MTDDICTADCKDGFYLDSGYCACCQKGEYWDTETSLCVDGTSNGILSDEICGVPGSASYTDGDDGEENEAGEAGSVWFTNPKCIGKPIQNGKCCVDNSGIDCDSITDTDADCEITYYENGCCDCGGGTQHDYFLNT